MMGDLKFYFHGIGGTRQIPNPYARLIHAIMADKISISRAKNVAPCGINLCESGSKSLHKPDLVPIRAFFTRLNERGLYGLQTQYHVIGKLSELPALEDVTECEELIQINDCGDDPVCYLPATRIKFAFNGRQKISAVFSQDGLSRLISRLQKIHDEGSKAVARYKGAVRDMPVVG